MEKQILWILRWESQQLVVLFWKAGGGGRGCETTKIANDIEYEVDFD